MPKDFSNVRLRSELDGVSSQNCEDLDATSVAKNGNETPVPESAEIGRLLEQHAELADMLAAGHADVEHGRTVEADEALSSLRRALSR